MRSHIDRFGTSKQAEFQKRDVEAARHRITDLIKAGKIDQTEDQLQVRMDQIRGLHELEDIKSTLAVLIESSDQTLASHRALADLMLNIRQILEMVGNQTPTDKSDSSSRSTRSRASYPEAQVPAVLERGVTGRYIAKLDRPKREPSPIISSERSKAPKVDKPKIPPPKVESPKEQLKQAKVRLSWMPTTISKLKLIARRMDAGKPVRKPGIDKEIDSPEVVKEKLRQKTAQVLRAFNVLRENNPDAILQILKEQAEYEAQLKRDSENKELREKTKMFDEDAYKRAVLCYIQTNHVRFSDEALEALGLPYWAQEEAKYETRRGEKSFAQIVMENKVAPAVADDPKAFMERMTDLSIKKRPITKNQEVDDFDPKEPTPEAKIRLYKKSAKARGNEDNICEITEKQDPEVISREKINQLCNGNLEQVAGINHWDPVDSIRSEKMCKLPEQIKKIAQQIIDKGYAKMLLEALENLRKTSPERFKLLSSSIMAEQFAGKARETYRKMSRDGKQSWNKAA